MNLTASQPIGVFDSGVGGLTVASAIQYVLPDETIIYFGDTAHLPYGDKSKESVAHYSKGIADFLIQKQCKVIVVACNTASAVAYDELKLHVGDRALVLDVIDPVVKELANKKKSAKVGVIGTKGTILSGTYEEKIWREDRQAQVASLATPLFVPMIEEGFVYDDISNAIIRAYLSNEKLKALDYLILGCTHYPIIKNQIRKFYEFNVEVLDSAQLVSNHLKELLKREHLVNETGKAGNKFYVSDYTDYFKKIAKMFFEEDIELEQIDIWK